jgi:hypothetical protein
MVTLVKAESLHADSEGWVSPERPDRCPGQPRNAAKPKTKKKWMMESQKAVSRRFALGDSEVVQCSQQRASGFLRDRQMDERPRKSPGIWSKRSILVAAE